MENKLIVLLSDNLSDRIEDYWHRNNLGSRTAGVYALLIKALKDEYPGWEPDVIAKVPLRGPGSRPRRFITKDEVLEYIKDRDEVLMNQMIRAYGAWSGDVRNYRIAVPLLDSAGFTGSGMLRQRTATPKTDSLRNPVGETFS